MGKLSRRAVLLGAGAVLGGLGTWVLKSSNPVMDGTSLLVPRGDVQTLNDASGLNETPIARHIVIKQDPGADLVAALRKELDLAAAENWPVNIGAARHSMGGQAIPRNGCAITFENVFLEADTDQLTYKVHAGARWSDVIAALDPIGFGPKVMQSNNDFGVAATFCVNAHGWPAPHGPMGSTVREIEMVLADGSVVSCSPQNNRDLFKHAMGGYGLTGLITSLTVEMSPNLRLSPRFQEVSGQEIGTTITTALADPTVNMVYGRMNVDRQRFFEDGLVISYRPDKDQSDLPAASGSGFVSKASKEIFRAQLGNERLKRWRWAIETGVGPRIGGGSATRNSLINEPVVTLGDGGPNRTDILHEYFVAPERFSEFVAACQTVIPSSYQELLNITLRYVKSDNQSILTYAPVPRIAAVMLFSQEMTARAEADMARMTRRLIDRVLDIGGSYYLPYRLHPTRAQFLKCYPRAPDFADQKRIVDPQLRLRNALWDTYLQRL